MSGTFVWLAAGGAWSTSIRVAAPASAAIGVDYSFYDANGNNLSLDTTGSYTGSSNDVNFALYANQPAEVDLLGATSNAPSYGYTQTGSVYAVFYCPDAITCSNVLPQLIYSALPSHPWSLSVPIAWDGAVWTQWSAVGIDDGGAHRVSLVIYNEDLTATNYTVQCLQQRGNPCRVGHDAFDSPVAEFRGWGRRDIRGTSVECDYDAVAVGRLQDPRRRRVAYSAVEMLQINGPSATTLQVAYDTAPTSTLTLRSVIEHPAIARGVHAQAGA